MLAAFLAVELLDELVFGAREAAWPVLRDDLDLSYAEVGLLAGVPAVVGSVLEPPLGVLGDVWRRRAVVAGGGAAFAAALALLATADGFAAALVALVLLFPAAGAFVSLTQATLMDREPERRELNMTRWAVAGGVGAVAGPLALGAFVLLGLGWRGLFAAMAVMSVALTLAVARLPTAAAPSGERPSLRELPGLLRRRAVLRWLVLLELADLMLDGLLAFLALYLVDEAAASASQGALAVAVWTGAGLAGGVALLRLLHRMPGLVYLRVSAVAAAALFAAFLLTPSLAAKLALVGALGLVTAGWYSIPKARLYAALPGRSGTAMALGSTLGVVGGAVPVVVGSVAERYGLDTALWLLLAGPLALVVGVPRSPGSAPRHTPATPP